MIERQRGAMAHTISVARPTMPIVPSVGPSWVGFGLPVVAMWMPMRTVPAMATRRCHTAALSTPSKNCSTQRSVLMRTSPTDRSRTPSAPSSWPTNGPGVPGRPGDHPEQREAEDEGGNGRGPDQAGDDVRAAVGPAVSHLGLDGHAPPSAPRRRIAQEHH